MVCRRCYKFLCSRAHNLVNLSSLRWGYFDERTKRLKDFFSRKMKKCFFGRNPKASYFMTETLILQKTAYILALFSEGEWFSYLFSVLRKISYKLEKTEKKFRIFFIDLFAKKIQSEKKFDITFRLKRSLHKPRKINGTMNPYLISVMRYTSWSEKESTKFFEKFWRFWQKNEGVILDDGNFVGPKSSLYLCCSSRKRTVSVSFISFEKYELRMRKKFSKTFFVISFAQKHQVWK